MERRLEVELPEEDLKNFSGGKKLRKWDRAPKPGRAWADEGRLGETGPEGAHPAEFLHTGARLPVEKEIKLPRYFFEKALASATEATFIMSNDGLDLIREIQSGKKEWKPKEDVDKRHIDVSTLDKIVEVNTDDEKILAEIKRLRRLQAYNIDELSKKINSDPEIIKIKDSSKPGNEIQEEYKKQLRKKIREEVRRIFEDSGESVKVALYLESCVHRKFVEIVDRKDEVVNGATPQETNSETQEKLKRLDQMIQSEEFTDEEREFFDEMIRKYPGDLQKAKEKIEDAGGTVDERWAEAFRMSYINDRKRAGFDKNRWGANIPLKPEKAEIFEKYLEFKLPVGLPHETAEDVEIGLGESKEKSFTAEQMAELTDLIKATKEHGDKVEESELRGIIEEIIQEDLIPEKIFSEEEIPDAVKFVMKFAKEI